MRPLMPLDVLHTPKMKSICELIRNREAWRSVYSPKSLAAVFAWQGLWLLLPAFPILVGSAGVRRALYRLNRQHNERAKGE